MRVAPPGPSGSSCFGPPNRLPSPPASTTRVIGVGTPKHRDAPALRQARLDRLRLNFSHGRITGVFQRPEPPDPPLLSLSASLRLLCVRGYRLGRRGSRHHRGARGREGISVAVG